jgi:hypothetical protein
VDEEIRQAVDAELELLRPEIRGSAARVEELLHPEFVEIGASGRRWDRAAMVAALVGGDLTDPGPIEVTDVEGIRLADDLIQVRFRTRRDTAGPVWRTSLWRRLDGRWRVYYHQGTPAAD